MKATKMLCVTILGVTAVLASVANAATVTLTSNTDTFLHEGAADNPFGGTTILQARMSDGAGELGRTLIKFDLPSTLAGGRVNSATLRIESAGVYDAVEPVAFNRMTQAWIENTATWNTSGAGAWSGGPGALGASVHDGDPDFTPSTTIPFAGTGTFFDMSVTKIAQRWAAGDSNYGLMVKQADESYTGAEKTLLTWTDSSPQAAPQLILNYSPLSPADLLVEQSNTIYAVNLGNKKVKALTTNLGSQVNDVAVNRAGSVVYATMPIVDELASVDPADPVNNARTEVQEFGNAQAARLDTLSENILMGNNHDLFGKVNGIYSIDPAGNATLLGTGLQDNPGWTYAASRAPNGDVYYLWTPDFASTRVKRIPGGAPGAAEVDLVLSGGNLIRAPRDLVVSADGSTLYVVGNGGNVVGVDVGSGVQTIIADVASSGDGLQAIELLADGNLVVSSPSNAAGGLFLVDPVAMSFSEITGLTLGGSSFSFTDPGGLGLMPVPEPASLVLALFAMVGLLVWRRR